jgi:hypothetical protein
MKPQFQVDQTPPTTGIHGSQEAENSRKNTINHKQKQSKQRGSKGQPYGEDSNSSSKQNPKKTNGTHLGDLPNFGKQNAAPDADYDFGGFDDFDDGESGGNNNEKSKFSNAEKFLDDFENEQKEGFKVEVKRPGQKKTA